MLSAVKNIMFKTILLKEVDLITAQNFALNEMRYHPIMPTWFFHNRWYATAFATWAPSSTSLPAALSLNPCNPETNLKIAGATVGTGGIILAGRSLTGQNRPAATISTYMDGVNANAGTTCVFANSSAPKSATLNDNISVLPP